MIIVRKQGNRAHAAIPAGTENANRWAAARHCIVFLYAVAIKILLRNVTKKPRIIRGFLLNLLDGFRIESENRALSAP
jgi:hypothetical protein